MKTIKTKTQPYESEHCAYYLVSKKSSFDKKGIIKERGKQLILRTRDCYKSTYPEFPNGKYYVYQIHIDPFMKGKPCKKYYLHDTKQNHKHLLGVEIFQSVDPKYIKKNQNSTFHVKGGVVTLEYERKLNKESRKSLMRK